MQETWVQSLDWGDSLKEGMATTLKLIIYLKDSALVKKTIFFILRKKMKFIVLGCSNYRTIALNSHASKVMLKILQARLQQYMNHELPNVQAGFKKRQRNQRSNCQHPLDHQKSKTVPEKTSISFLLTMPKPLTVWITINCGKF